MPIFEYRCRACGAKFEKIEAASATDATCVSCNSPQVERLLSVYAVGGVNRQDVSSTESPCQTCNARERGLCHG
jgi:putative FmdB family regulatory protein